MSTTSSWLLGDFDVRSSKSGTTSIISIGSHNILRAPAGPGHREGVCFRTKGDIPVEGGDVLVVNIIEINRTCCASSLLITTANVNKKMFVVFDF
jgi:hypothetical protein